MPTPAATDPLWESLHATGSIEHRRAAVAAFAMVAVADGKATATEVSAFRSRVATSAVFKLHPLELLLDDFDELIGRLLRNEPAAQREVEARIRAATDPTGRQVTLAAARLAVVSDGEVAEHEETVLKHIAGLLGMDPELA